MKNYKVRLRGAAKRDVKVLNRYLIRNFSESKVNEVLTSLQESITRLGRMPNLVRDARELSSVLQGFCFLRLPKNTIFYGSTLNPVDGLLCGNPSTGFSVEPFFVNQPVLKKSKQLVKKCLKKL